MRIKLDENIDASIVLRGANYLFSTMGLLIETLIDAITKESPAGRLWIIEHGRLCVHESDKK